MKPPRVKLKRYRLSQSQIDLMVSALQFFEARLEYEEAGVVGPAHICAGSYARKRMKPLVDLMTNAERVVVSRKVSM